MLGQDLGVRVWEWGGGHSLEQKGEALSSKDTASNRWT